MTTVTLRGNTVEIAGMLPSKGQKAPDFVLTALDMTEISLTNYGNKRKILSIFPSLDTPTCAISVRKFNEKAAALDNTVVLCISADLPFAQKRFCGAEGIEQVVTLSTFRHPDFLERWGVKIKTGPLTGLAARAVIVLAGDNNVLYAELVSEISDEPDYNAVITALL